MMSSTRLESHLLTIARKLDAALFLTGSQYYAGDGEDHDFRMVVPDPLSAAAHATLRANHSGLQAPDHSRVDIVGLKFERLGRLVSLQLMSLDVVRRLCSLAPTSVHVLRTTPTSLANDIYGFDDEFEVSQPHKHLDSGAWLVSINQSPQVQGRFVTHVYHNMIIGCRVLRDAHGFQTSREELLRGVTLAITNAGHSIESGFERLLRRSFSHWTTQAREELFAAARETASRCSPVYGSSSKPQF